MCDILTLIESSLVAFRSVQRYISLLFKTYCHSVLMCVQWAVGLYANILVVSSRRHFLIDKEVSYGSQCLHSCLIKEPVEARLNFLWIGNLNMDECI